MAWFKGGERQSVLENSEIQSSPRKHSLDGVILLEGMSEEERTALAARCRWQQFDSGQQMLGHQDESKEVCFLISGRARVIIYSVAGRAVIFRDALAGEVFGEFSAIDDQPRSATVEAASPCLVASMPAQSFWQLLRDYPSVNAALLQWLTAQTRALTERILEFSTLAVKNRLHAELLRRARKNVQPDGTARISRVPTHAEFASRISTHREAVTREMNELEVARIIERRDGEIIVLEMQRLEEMVQEVLGENIL